MRVLLALLCWLSAVAAESISLDTELQARFKAKPLRAPTSVKATVPFQYPLYSQCDSHWGNDMMGSKTICAVGCLMSSTSMALAGTKIPIIPPPSTQNVASNPGTFNAWLKVAGGYDDNSFIEPVAEKLDPSRVFWPADAMHKTSDLSWDTVVSYLNKGRIMIANVNAGGHFVLVVGYGDDKDTLFINDPGYNRDSYSFSKDVVGWRIFDMVR